MITLLSNNFYYAILFRMIALNIEKERKVFFFLFNSYIKSKNKEICNKK